MYGDALAHRLPLYLEALGNGQDGLQTVLAHPARVRSPGQRQDRIGVPHHYLDQAADDVQVDQHRTRCVRAGVGDQLADRQLGDVQSVGRCHPTLRQAPAP